MKKLGSRDRPGGPPDPGKPGKKILKILEKFNTTHSWIGHFSDLFPGKTTPFYSPLKALLNANLSITLLHNALRYFTSTYTLATLPVPSRCHYHSLAVALLLKGLVRYLGQSLNNLYIS